MIVSFLLATVARLFLVHLSGGIIRREQHQTPKLPFIEYYLRALKERTQQEESKIGTCVRNENYSCGWELEYEKIISLKVETQCK